MKTVGKVLKLFISKKDTMGVTKTHEQTNISLDEKGVLDDKFYAKQLQRAILLSSYESYRIAKANKIDMPYGSLGENILMDFNPYELNDGDQIQIGNVLLEITQHCTLCKGLSKVDAKAPKLLKDHRGIFAKTVTSGSIHLDDIVSL
ncbi:MOSC domain-containing protein [Sulfurimonas sp. MAG313]|nr:MOSC domain-containing protein [Sulfurimonas sp. MAG313]MDF1879837.1 MOSC domain-containing protein [Sulfurimonas sp. MAG313]